MIRMLVLLLILIQLINSIETQRYGRPSPSQSKFSFESLSSIAKLPTSFEVLGCKVSVLKPRDGDPKSSCVRIFKPNVECFQQKTLSKIFEFLSNKVLDQLNKLTNSIFPPHLFRVIEFNINSCEKNLHFFEFTCQAADHFYFINEKFKIIEGKLNLKVDYGSLKNSFNFMNIGFDIDGKMRIANKQDVSFKINKDFRAISSYLSLNINEIVVTDFSKLFLRNDLNREAIISNGGMLSKISNVAIKVMINSDRSYEVIVNGDIDTRIPGLSVINGLLVIQNSKDSPIGVGIVVSLKNIDPLKVISSIINAQLPDINILKDLRLDITVEYANKDIKKLKDSVIETFMSALKPKHPVSFSKGTVISLNIPIQEIIMRIGSPANLINIPKDMAFQVIIKSEKLSFVFPPNIFEDGINILAALAPSAFNLLQEYVFKSNFKIIFKKYDVNIQTKQVEISISIPNKITLFNILSVENTVFELKLVGTAFDFTLEANLVLGDILVKVKVVKNGKKFSLSGSIPGLTLNELMKIFGADEIKRILPNRFEFKLVNLILSGEFGEKAESNLRLKGTAIFSIWKEMVFEAFMKTNQISGKQNNFSINFMPNNENQYINRSSSVIDSYISKRNIIPDENYNYEQNVVGEEDIKEMLEARDISGSAFESSGSESNAADLFRRNSRSNQITKTDKQMGLSFIIKDVKFHEIIALFYDNPSKETSWISLDIAFIISNTELKEFTLEEIIKEFKDEKVGKGVYFNGKMRLLNNCLNSALCKFAKTYIASEYFVTARYTDGFFFEAGFKGNTKLTENLSLSKAYFGVSIDGGSVEISLNGELTLQLSNSLLKFKVSIGVDLLVGLKLGGEMVGMWKEPFSKPNIAVGNAKVSATIQFPFALLNFELAGRIELGNSNNKIIAEAGVGIDLLGKDNFFYGDVNKLSLGAFSRAFSFNLNLPDVVLESGFKKLSIEFSGHKMTVNNRDLRQGFNLEGILNVLGLVAKTKVTIEPGKLLFDCELSPIGSSSSLYQLTRSLTDTKNGPKIFIQISSRSSRFYIQGAINMLRISSAVTIDIDNNGLQFYIEGNMFNLFHVNLLVKASYGNKMSLEKAGFQVSACLSTEVSNKVNKETNEELKDTINDVNNIVSYAERKFKKISAQHKKLVSRKESLSNLRNKLFDKMTVTYGKIEEYQRQVDSSCTDQCHKETGYFSKSWCSANCLLDKGETSIRIEKKKEKQTVRSTAHGRSFIEDLKSLTNKAEEYGKKMKNGLVVIKDKVVDSRAFKGIKSGFKLAKNAAGSVARKIINIRLICFNTSLEIAYQTCFNVTVHASIVGRKENEFNVGTCFRNVEFVKDIAQKVKNYFYSSLNFIKGEVKFLKARFGFHGKKAKELSKKTLLIEKKVKKWEEEVNKDDVDSDEKNIGDEITRKNILYKNITIEDIKRQIYNDHHIVSLTDGDVLDALDIYPDYSLEFDFSKIESSDVSDLARQIIGEKDNCKLAQGLVRNYEKISNQLNEMLSFLDHQKQLHKKQCLDATHKFNSLEKVAIQKCRRMKCNKKQRQKLLHLSHSLTHAHVTRTNNLDKDFEAIGKRLIQREKETMTRNIDSIGMNLKTFLSKLKHSTETASLLPSKTNEFKLRLNASFKAVENLLVNDLPYENVALSFQSMKRDLAILRENIPCAA